MKKLLPVFIAAALLGSGCEWNRGPEELERLVKEDPAFKAMILHRNQSHSAIDAIKADLLEKKKIADAQVDKIRNDYDLYAKAQNKKIEQYRAAIEANRTKLKNDITAADGSIEAKETELEGYQKTLVDVQRMLRESKGITLSPQEKKKWEERLLMLQEKIRPLSEEITELKLQIRLKKQKTGYLD